MRLMVEVGDGCAKLMDQERRDLRCERVQVDEICSYVQKKQSRVTPRDNRARIGDMWTFVALDPDSKLIPAYRVGKRTREHAVAFMADLSGRLTNRVQLSSDSLNTYVDAVERAFGADVDYGQAVKFYDAEPIGPGRYAPPRVVRPTEGRGGRKPRPASYLDKPCRAPEPNHAYVHAEVYASHECVFEEG